MQFATLTFLCTMTIALAQMPPGPPTAPPDLTALKTATGITDAQITQLENLQRDERNEVQTLVAQIQTAEQNLRTALSAANPVAATVGQLAIQVQNLRKQVQTIQDGYHTRALALLTADVKAKVDALGAAAKLQPAIHQAGMLNLLTPPDPPNGPGGPGPGGPGGGPGGLGPMGFRPRH